MKIKIILVANLILLISLDLMGQSHSSNIDCNLILSVDDSTLIYNKADKKYINLSVYNQGIDTIAVPEWFCLSLDDFTENAIRLTIEIWDVGLNKFTQPNHDTVIDYSCSDYGCKNEFLPPRKFKKIKEQIDFPYGIERVGLYRIKVILTMENTNGFCKIQTDWKAFEVK